MNVASHIFLPVAKKTKSKACSCRKMRWSPAEDQIIFDYVKKYGTSNWSFISQQIPGRTGKQCRERWVNQLNPENNNDHWTTEEDQLLLDKTEELGHQWSVIARYLNGRSANSVKNRFQLLKRRRKDQISSHGKMAPQSIMPPYPMFVMPQNLSYDIIPYIQQPMIQHQQIMPQNLPCYQVIQVVQKM